MTRKRGNPNRGRPIAPAPPLATELELRAVSQRRCMPRYLPSVLGASTTRIGTVSPNRSLRSGPCLQIHMLPRNHPPVERGVNPYLARSGLGFDYTIQPEEQVGGVIGFLMSSRRDEI
jgi:hypothetical protein